MNAPSTSPIKPARWLKTQAKAVNRWIKLTILIGFISGLLLIWQAHVLGKLVDQAFLNHRPLGSLISLLVSFGVIILIRALLAYGKERTSFAAGAKLRTQLREDVMHKLEQLGPIHAAKWSSAQLSTMMMENVEALQGFYANFLPQMYLALMIPLAIVAFVFPYSWIAGITLFIAAPLIPIFMAVIGMGAASMQRKNFQMLSRMSATFLDMLEGLPTLKWFGQSKRMADRIFEASEGYRTTTMSVLRVVFLSSAVLEFFAALAIALLATYLGLSFLHFYDVGYWGHHLTLTGALFMLILAPEFFLPLRELNTHYHARAEAVGAAEQLIEFFNYQPNQILSDTAQTDSSQHTHSHLHTHHSRPIDTLNQVDSIRFNHVTVQFAESKTPAIDQFSLEIQSGDKLAILGESGAGKTTLINLLLGFIEPTKGAIIVNNMMELSKIDLTLWRKKIAWLPQTNTLFYGTIRENLLLYKPHATDAEIDEALSLACAKDFINDLPLGLETQISEQNQGLSGGQIQRIALARLYLHNAPIWLLDEPTASLDTDCEQQVFENLLRFTEDKTVLLVTHKSELATKMGTQLKLR